MDLELYLRLSSKHELYRLGMIVAAERHHVARKSYTLGPRMRQEVELLHSLNRYGRRSTVLGSLSAKLFYRAMGMTLIHEASSEEPAFAARRDGARGLLSRQLLKRREGIGRGFAEKDPTRGKGR